MFSFIALRPPPIKLTLAGRAKSIFSYPEWAIQLSGRLRRGRKTHRKGRVRAKGLYVPLDGEVDREDHFTVALCISQVYFLIFIPKFSFSVNSKIFQ